jgi:hypothetical protein
MSTENNRRSHKERIEAIFEFIEKQPNVFPKSRFNEIGLNPRTAEMWLKLIDYIQNQPKIRLIQTEHNMLVEKVEGKYQALMRRMSADESVPFEQRSQYLTDYLKSLYARERIKDSSKSTPQGVGNQNQPFNPQEIVKQILNALHTFSFLDSKLDKYAQTLKDAYSNHSDEDSFTALSKWQKEVLLNKDFKMDLKRILDKEYFIPKIEKITKKIPDFMERLKIAKQTINNYYAYLRENIADWFFDDEST